MTAADRRPPPSPALPSLGQEVTPGIVVWKEPYEAPEEVIREFTRLCSSGTEQDGASTALAPWQVSLVRRVLESVSTNSPDAIMGSRSQRYGKTAVTGALRTSLAREWRGMSPRSVIVDEVQRIPSLHARLASRPREPVRRQELEGRWLFDEPCRDQRWEGASHRRRRLSVELSLESEACRSLMR